MLLGSSGESHVDRIHGAGAEFNLQGVQEAARVIGLQINVLNACGRS
jgi:hypothetical protein